ncbi:unnamed protein product [Sphagnum jensenii]
MLSTTERDRTHGTSGTLQIIGFRTWGTNTARPKVPMNQTGEKNAYIIQPFALKPQYQACPTAPTSNTVVIPFKAPRATTYFTQLMPTVWNATEYGAFWSISGVGTIEHKTCNDDKDEDKHVDKCSNPVEIGGALGAPDCNCSSSNEDSYGNWVELIVARSEVGFNLKLRWIFVDESHKVRDPTMGNCGTSNIVFENDVSSSNEDNEVPQLNS